MNFDLGTKITKKNKYKYSSPERLKRGSPKNFSLLANKKKFVQGH